MKYGDTYHVAPYKVGTSTIQIYNEGNYEPCQKTEREIPIGDPKILGYFDVDLWIEIQKLSPTLKDILWCESRNNHYTPIGSVVRGDSGQSYGIAQFQRKTWNWFNKLRYEKELPKIYDILDPYSQIEMLGWAEKENLLDHWSCYKPATSI